MSDFTAWILSIGSFAAIVLCIAVAARSIAGDPSGGRRRCPRCWHDLGPAEREQALRCAECGQVARDERETLRTRRRLGRAALAIAVAFAVTAAVRVRMFDAGPWGGLPTSVLIWAIPYTSDGTYRSAAWELSQRILRGNGDDATLHGALDLFVRGDAGAPPGSDAWRAKYRDLGTAILNRMRPDDPEQVRLMEIPPVLASEAVHGSRSPRLVAVDADVWWPSSMEGRVTVRMPDGSLQRARFDPDGRFPPLYLALPDSARTGEPIACTLSFRPRAAIVEHDDEGWTAYPELTLQVPAFEPAGAEGADGFRGVDGVEMRELVASVFNEGLIVWGSGEPRAGLRFNARATDGERFEGVAVGVIVEVLEDGVPRRTSRMWWRNGSLAGQPRWTPADEDAEALARLHAGDPAQDARWTLRIRGDEEIARRALPSQPSLDEKRRRAAEGAMNDEELASLDRAVPDRWFSGSIEVPLRVERASARSPARRWRP